MSKKPSVDEALEAWRQAEDKYHKAIEAYIAADTKKAPRVTKDDAVVLTKARAKADRKMATYFEASLG